MNEVFCGGTLPPSAEEAMAADAIIAEASSVFLQQLLLLFIGLDQFMRRSSAMHGASAF